MTQPPHDYEDPMHYLNGIEAALLKAALPPCRWCKVRRELLAMPGNGWGVETFHQPSCPEHEDNRRDS